MRELSRAAPDWFTPSSSLLNIAWSTLTLLEIGNTSAQQTLAIQIPLFYSLLQSGKVAELLYTTSTMKLAGRFQRTLMHWQSVASIK